MMHILRCNKCGSFGMEEKCSCGGTRAKPKPPKYSPEDKYGDYRRKFKEANPKENDDVEDDDDEESTKEEE
jgi:H/ACA ribonucleoprotein complex subunit 3